MASFNINLLDGADGYLRWKESVLLLLHSVDVAYVLFDEPAARAGGGGGDGDGSQAVAAAKKWARDDGLCRGHILSALSGRLLPVYQSTSGRALWQAVARTYEPDATSWELEFREDETLRERVARAESLAVATKSRIPKPCGEMLAYMVGTKVPDVAEDAIMQMKGDQNSMDGLWRSAQGMERVRNCRQARKIRAAREDRISDKRRR